MKRLFRRIVSVLLVVVFSFSMITSATPKAAAASKIWKEIGFEALGALVSEAASGLGRYIGDIFSGLTEPRLPMATWTDTLYSDASNVRITTVSQLERARGQLEDSGYSVVLADHPSISGGYVVMRYSDTVTDPKTGNQAVLSSSVGAYLCNTSGQLIVGFASVNGSESDVSNVRKDIWLPFSTATSKKQVSVLTKDSLSDLCVTVNQADRTCSVRDTIINEKSFYVIIDTRNNIYANADGVPYVAHYEATVTDQKYDYIVNEGDTINEGDNIYNDNSTIIEGSTTNYEIVDNSKVIDLTNGTFTYIGEQNKEDFYIDELIYDFSSQSYQADTYNITYDDDTYTTNNFLFHTTYNITNVYVTNIGQTELYEPLELYYVLPDGRSSADLTAEEIAGMSFEFADCVNYAKSATDTYLRALYHFDGNTDDSSYFSTQGKFEWLSGASISYMDVGTFNGALYLGPESHSFKITLPSNIGSGDFTLQFRYYQAGSADTQSNIENFVSIGGTTVLQWDEGSIYNGSGTKLTSLSVGTWQELAVMRCDGTLSLYHNGLRVSSSFNSSAWNNEIVLTLGSTTRAYSMIDELRVVNKSLFVGTSVESISGLPDGYKLLDYIASDGTQYIDTEFKPSSNTRTVMDIENLYAGQAALFGARDSSSQNSNLLWALSATGFRSDYFASTTNLVNGAVDTVTGRYTIDKNKNICVAKGVIMTNTAVSFTCSYSMFLFTLSTAGSPNSSMARMRLYSCQIYESGSLVRDYVPCLNPNEIAGLYDRVNGLFYSSASTSAFTAGSVLDDEQEVTYELSYYAPTSVPYDTNAVLVLPDSAFPIADEYWEFKSSGTNILAPYGLDDWTGSRVSLGAYFNSWNPYSSCYAESGYASPDGGIWEDGVSSGTKVYSFPEFYYANNLFSYESFDEGIKFKREIAFSNLDYLYSKVRAMWDESSSSAGSMYWYTSSGGNMIPTYGIYSILASRVGKTQALSSGAYTFSLVNSSGETSSVTFTLPDATSHSYKEVCTDAKYTKTAFGYEFGMLRLEQRDFDSDLWSYAYFLVVTPVVDDPEPIMYMELVSGSSTDLTAEWVNCMYSSEEVKPNTAAIQTDIPIKGYTVGGVRPTFPARGDVWMPVNNNRITNVYVYNGSAWEEVNARWYTGTRWIPIYGFDITTLEDCWDIADIDTTIVMIGSESQFWSWLQGAWQKMLDKLDAIIIALGGDPNYSPDSSGGGGTGLWDRIKTAFSDALASIIESLMSFITDVLQLVLDLVYDLLSFFFDFLSTEVVTGIANLFSSFTDGSLLVFFQQEITSTDEDGNEVTTTVIGLPDGIATAFAFFAGVIMILPEELRNLLIFGVGALVLIGILKLAKS